MVYPHAKVKKIVIEGSDDPTKEGEYIIDVTEYSEEAGHQHVDYYQLKHSTVQVDIPFTLSDLQDTITGFAKRYAEWKDKDAPVIAFAVITNRKVADSFRNGIKKIADGNDPESNFKSTIEKYTGLLGDDLRGFCRVFSLQDSEGDYNVQQEELKSELAKLIADPVDHIQVVNLVEMVQEKVLPHSQNTIVREDVLKRFGITSERHLYPAPAELETSANIIELSQYKELKEKIDSSNASVIVHAEGGVGKSVFCRHLVDSLPAGSIGIIYDCFGAGKYRNRSEPRHGHRQALTQIVNELASKGLCRPLLISNTSRDEDIVRTFLERVKAATESLQKVVASAKLFILLDAADNAEMAAHDFNQNCFAHELIREQMPTGCQLVFLCRTERIHLLKPPGDVPQLLLKSFSEAETLLSLRTWFPLASEHDGREFHRLTSANPRVQANALNAKYGTIHEVLASLGPGGLSVEKIIESQLHTAIEKLKKNHFEQQVKAICLGLAILPPHIPISVLAQASHVDESTIKSFVSDIGRSLWILDSSVQFRDEPTETWFRKTFSGKPADYKSYVKLLEPLAQGSTYVSEVLPHLYLQAEQYQKLIQVSLTDDFLPTDNPIDARTIRVYRLQFAFKAALKTRKIPDAIKVAIKAGEEVAGNQRQLQLLQDNIELLILLQSKVKIQEIGFKQQLRGAWDGSENIYTASLLSGIKEYQGEARGYLRSGVNWLRIALEEIRSRKKEERPSEERITKQDILEVAYAMLNLDGADACIGFLNRLNPEFVFGVLQRFTARLMDEGRFDEIDQLLQSGKSHVYNTVAIVSNLMQLGKIPDRAVVNIALDLLCHPKARMKKPQAYHFDHVIPEAIVTFADCCVALHLPPEKILRVLRHYIPIRASRTVGNEHLSDDRHIFLKALSIRMMLSGLQEPDFDEILPQDYLKEKKSYDEQNSLTEFKETILGLLPWYLLRLRILTGEKVSLMDTAHGTQQASGKARSQRYRSYDRIPGEISLVCSSIVILVKDFPPEDIVAFYNTFLKSKESFSLWGKLALLNAAGRLPHLTSFRSELEQTTYEIVKTIKGDGPDAIAARYIALARAVLTVDIADARVYFDKAIDIASKFGDEIVQRWEALVGLAEQASEKTATPNSLAYRFIRCAEVVGESVAREKHWSRYDAMRVCTKMSPGIGLSAVSRWRDRDIGRFQYEFMATVGQLQSMDKIDSSVAWSMSRFFSREKNDRFLKRCLAKTESQLLRQAILEDDIRLDRIDCVVDISYWSKIRLIAEEWIDDKDWIKGTFSFLDKVPIQPVVKDQPHDNSRVPVSSVNWEEVFRDVDMVTTDGFAELINRHRKQISDEHYGIAIRDLLSECLIRLNPANLEGFIDMLFASLLVDRYDFQVLFEAIPAEWTRKVSFAAKWNSIIRKFSERYAFELTNSYGFDSLVKSINANDELKTVITEGINAGLINAKDLDSGETFFAYVKLSACCVTEADARHLLDYALQRFEHHIEPETADGEWSEWLDVHDNINHNLAGVIWSALGSPRATERWSAAHCVRTLIEFNCSAVVHELMTWAEHNKVDAFGSHLFPFYNLHARQYLLIALARVSKDLPDRLTRYNSLLKKYALESDHILIQKFASDTCLNIESAFSGTFDAQTIEALSYTTKSKLPLLAEKKRQYQTESYWHANKLIDENVEYHFAWDFDRYWYQPLGDVFGIPEKQVEDLAASVLVTEWRNDYDGKHQSDPRVGIWNRNSSERETWHDHGRYPKADNLDFYLCYHAMLVVAGRLLQKMPVLSSQYEDGNAWENWLSRHLLTRTDGKWLADHRDSLPIIRPDWISTERLSLEEWKNAITETDFLKCLMPAEVNGFITAKGGWHEKKNERIETFYIASACVSKTASDALLRAWATAIDQHDYKVPDYEEEDMEFDEGIFKLTGWIVDPDSQRELDEHDPYADKVQYPSYRLGQTILDILNLKPDEDGKKWFNEREKCVAICASWTSAHSERDEETDQAGMRISVDLATARELCQSLDCELIIKASIARRLSYRGRSYEDRDIEQEQHRIFILNEHGELRTIEKNYRLGEADR